MVNGQDLTEIGKNAGQNWPLIVFGFLLLLDKAGYYLKRKGSNGSGAVKKEDLIDAIRTVVSEREGGKDTDTKEIALLPGHSDQCITNARDITELKTIVPFVRQEVKRLNAKVDRNHTSVKSMFEKIDRDLKVIRTNGKTQT